MLKETRHLPLDRKKELKELYKNMKADMGIFIIKAKFNNKCYIETTHNLKGTINGAEFRLRFGNHLNRELQKEWKEHGKENFTMEILEGLAYDKDQSKTDYNEELEILQMVWQEKLSKQGLEFYKE